MGNDGAQFLKPSLSHVGVQKTITMLTSYVYLNEKEKGKEEDIEETHSSIAHKIAQKVSNIFTLEFRQIETRKFLISKEFRDHIEPIYAKLEADARQKAMAKIDELSSTKRKQREKELEAEIDAELLADPKINQEAISNVKTRLLLEANTPKYSFGPSTILKLPHRKKLKK